jgi:hypothetical protein
MKYLVYSIDSEGDLILDEESNYNLASLPDAEVFALTESSVYRNVFAVVAAADATFVVSSGEAHSLRIESIFLHGLICTSECGDEAVYRVHDDE